MSKRQADFEQKLTRGHGTGSGAGRLMSNRSPRIYIILHGNRDVLLQQAHQLTKQLVKRHECDSERPRATVMPPINRPRYTDLNLTSWRTFGWWFGHEGKSDVSFEIWVVVMPDTQGITELRLARPEYMA
ncbi:hypothetical protein RRG08_012404 [Elysia crispata]|uniref:Uncharacterized protein n=1 Tax=Elysia crispata TaxID=231223 RepID=A0AAE0YK69_9GAST|nr:hypothetical protein RRG08_012404 [Elysia crispata]